MMAASSLDYAVDTPLKRVRSAIDGCIRHKQTLQPGRLLRAATFTKGQTTKHVFRRVLVKYGDNSVHCLDATSDGPVRGANTFADAWVPVFQQPRQTVRP
ncbi:hypothetical protein CCR75_007763 [Bremia lactucae]|uniref:Uncharacterized protein n=1 Tax=Bremia lactucae TaxID=4779 RepID=A0A976II99_BRELC|nr:hypothetical protein CCR75_007763 [Bremia lactucae]